MPTSDVQKFLAEEEERKARKLELIQRILTERDEKMAEYEEQLTLLGYRADVVARPASTRREGARRERRAAGQCTICGFATEPAHDGRLKAHRDQGQSKKALTESQLEGLGLRRA